MKGEGKTTVIVNVEPKWARIATVQALTGLPDNVIRRLYNEHRIRAKKTEPDKANSACVFCLQDVYDWIENEAADSPPFKLP